MNSCNFFTGPYPEKAKTFLNIYAICYAMCTSVKKLFAWIFRWSASILTTDEFSSWFKCQIKLWPLDGLSSYYTQNWTWWITGLQNAVKHWHWFRTVEHCTWFYYVTTSNIICLVSRKTYTPIPLFFSFIIRLIWELLLNRLTLPGTPSKKGQSTLGDSSLNRCVNFLFVESQEFWIICF